MATKRSISIYISTGCPWGNDKDVNKIGEKPGGFFDYLYGPENWVEKSKRYFK